MIRPRAAVTNLSADLVVLRAVWLPRGAAFSAVLPYNETRSTANARIAARNVLSIFNENHEEAWYDESILDYCTALSRGEHGNREPVSSAILPSETWMKLGMLPRRSSEVCIFTADFVVRKLAHGNIDMHRSIVVESTAYTELLRCTAKLSPA